MILVKVNWTIAPAPIRPTPAEVVSSVTTWPTPVAVIAMLVMAVEPIPLLVEIVVPVIAPAGTVQPLPKVTTMALVAVA